MLIAIYFICIVMSVYVLLFCSSSSFCRMVFILLQRNRSDSDPEFVDSNLSETVKDEATFEDKIVDTMVLEDPQNMYRALEK